MVGHSLYTKPNHNTRVDKQNHGSRSFEAECEWLSKNKEAPTPLAR